MSEHKLALKKIFAEVAKEQLSAKTTTLYVRVHEKGNATWPSFLEALLLGSVTGSAAEWKLDASKYFYPDKGVVKYLWRLVFSGDVAAGLSLLTRCANNAGAKSVVELDSFELVGRVAYEHDPVNGKIKGGYGLSEGARVMASTPGGAGGG